MTFAGAGETSCDDVRIYPPVLTVAGMVNSTFNTSWTISDNVSDLPRCTVVISLRTPSAKSVTWRVLRSSSCTLLRTRSWSSFASAATLASSIQEIQAPGRDLILSVSFPSSESKPGRICPSDDFFGVQMSKYLSFFAPSPIPKVSPQLIRPSTLDLILSVKAKSESELKLRDRS